MLLDVNSPLPNQSLNRGDPSSSYDSDYLTRIFGVVEAFKNYPNTLGFFGGNEVINDDPSGGIIPPYLRSVTRDLKNYISKHVSRPIPVGYSAADVRDILADTWEYLQCALNGDKNDMSRTDFFGLNSYSWCGDASFQSSGYDVLVQQFSNTTVPVFFSEYGCNKVTPRIFTEVESLYGPQMVPVMSGGLVYEYSQEVSNFGLVVLNDNNTASLRQDYDNLQSEYNKLNVTLLESGNSTAATLTPPKCTSNLITSQGFANKFSIPPVPPGGQKLIDNGIANPNQGKLIPLPSSNNVPEIVYASNGQIIQGLAIKPLPADDSNTPTDQNTSGSATTSSPSGPSATKKGEAAGRSRGELGSVLGLIGCVVFMMAVL